MEKVFTIKHPKKVSKYRFWLALTSMEDLVYILLQWKESPGAPKKRHLFLWAADWTTLESSQKERKETFQVIASFKTYRGGNISFCTNGILASNIFIAVLN